MFRVPRSRKYERAASVVSGAALLRSLPACDSGSQVHRHSLVTPQRRSVAVSPLLWLWSLWQLSTSSAPLPATISLLLLLLLLVLPLPPPLHLRLCLSGTDSLSEEGMDE